MQYQEIQGEGVWFLHNIWGRKNQALMSDSKYKFTYKIYKHGTAGYMTIYAGGGEEWWEFTRRIRLEEINGWSFQMCPS